MKLKGEYNIPLVFPPFSGSSLLMLLLTHSASIYRQTFTHSPPFPVRYLSKARNTPAATKQERLATLQQRIMLVERFVQARKMVKTDPAETVKICTQLLSSQSRIDNAIRVGDVFALLIEYYYKAKEFQKAYALIQQMRDRNIIISPYLDKEMTDTIYREVGATAEIQGGGKKNDGNSDGDGEIGEDIGGEIDSDDLGRFSDGSGSDDDYMSQLTAKK